MRVKLMTDAPIHNLALMKISAYHKQRGDEVFIGQPMDKCDLSYASWLFHEYSFTSLSGGPGSMNIHDRLENHGIATLMPDYSLFPQIDYSLGYTWEYCPRHCEFCVTSRQHLKQHHNSILDFLHPNFKKIRILNNNTFTDPHWRETFQEIWEARLTLIDEGGYDLRLLDNEKLEYLNKTHFVGLIHFAFDRAEDETEIRRGLEFLKGIKHPVQIYVLVGYPKYRPIDRTDIDRCEIIKSAGFDPHIMVYNREIKTKNPSMQLLNRYYRMVNRTFQWRKHGFQKAWELYR